MNSGTTTRTASAFAPGRVELLGNHTDYNEGLVLGAAIDRGLTVAGTARTDDVIKLSSNSMGYFEATLRDLKPQKESTWANFVLGVAHELIELRIPVGGFGATIEGDIPSCSGLSSSAALEIATALFLLKLHDRKLSPMELAKLSQRAEHRFVGVQSGLLDQVVSVFGQPNHLVFFDTRAERVQLIEFPSDLALIIAQSGKQRELSRGDYNLRREQTGQAAQALGVRALRDVSLVDLEKRTDLDPLLSRRARHIIGENERVQRAVELLIKGDATGFGQLLNQSHQSSRDNFENSTPELDRLVDLAGKIEGVVGARLTGAGFGGAMLAVCQRLGAESAVLQLRENFFEQTGRSTEMFVCQIAGGAR